MSSGERAMRFADPASYLAHLQRACPPRSIPDADEMLRRAGVLEALGKAMPEGFRSPACNYAKAYDEAVAEAAASRPTEEQDANELVLLRLAVDVVRTVMSRARLELPAVDIVFGTLNTGDPNAMVIRCPTGGYVVAVNAGVMTLLYLVSKAIGLAIDTSVSVDGRIDFRIPEAIDKVGAPKRGEALERFAEALRCCAKLGDARTASRWNPSQSALVWGGLLTQVAERFLVAHELAHIQQGHLAGAVGARTCVGSEEVDSILYSWDQEGEADLMALALTLGTPLILKGFSAHTMGTVVLFKCIEYILRMRGLPTHSKSHPAPEWRLQGLLEGAESALGEPLRTAVRDARALTSLLDSMWARIQEPSAAGPAGCS